MVKKNIFKLISIVTVLFMFLQFVPFNEANAEEQVRFSDVNQSLYGEQVKELVNRGVIKGYSDNTFRPDQTITRLQAITMIVREMGLDTTNRPNPSFSDVTPGMSGYDLIATAVDEGIMEGKGNGKFDPYGKLTRGEMAKILVNAYQLTGSTDNEFTDVPDGYWAKPYIKTLVANEITLGYSNGTFRPWNDLTRLHFTLFIYRYINQFPDEVATTGIAYNSNDALLANKQLTFTDDKGNTHTVQTDETGYFVTKLVKDRKYSVAGNGILVELIASNINDIQVTNKTGKVTLGRTLVSGDNQTTLQASAISIGEELASKIEISEDQSEVTVEEEVDIKAGDIFILPKTEQYQGGLALKAEYVTLEDGKTIIETSEPQIEEVYTSIKGSTHVPLTSEYFEPESGVTVEGIEGVSTAAVDDKLKINLNGIFDEDDPIKLNGALELDGDFSGDIDWALEFDLIDSFDFRFEGSQVLKGEVVAQIEPNEPYKRKIGTFHIPTSIPTVTADIPVHVVVDAEGKVGVEFTAEMKEDIGIKYHDDNGFDVYPEDNFQASFDVKDPQVAGKVTVGVMVPIYAASAGIDLVGFNQEVGVAAEAKIDLIGDTGLHCAKVLPELYYKVAPEAPIVNWISDADITKTLEFDEIEFGNCEITEGTLVGKVIDAVTGSPIDDASVKIYKEDRLIEEVASLVDGTYEVSLLPDDYKVEVSYSGYLSEMSNIRITEANSVTYDAKLQLVGEQYSGTGVVKGHITNAINGNAAPGLKIDFRKGRNTTEGEILATVTTDSEGNYQTELPGGNYTAEVSGEGYISTSFNILAVGGKTLENQNATISPAEVIGDNLRVVLTWGELPEDLDSHLTGPTDDGSRFHVYYSNQEYEDNTTDVNLDVDDTDSYGPETVTVINGINNGTYTYAVHNYSYYDSENNLDLSGSNATVRIYSENTLISTYNVPIQKDGNVWRVFEVRNGVIVPINKMDYIDNWHDADSFAPEM